MKFGLREHGLPTSYTSTAIRDGDCEHPLLPFWPVVGIIGRVGRLRDEHDLPGRVVLEEIGIDARDIFDSDMAQLIQGRRPGDVLQMAVFDYSQGHFRLFTARMAMFFKEMRTPFALKNHTVARWQVVGAGPQVIIPRITPCPPNQPPRARQARSEGRCHPLFQRP